MAVLCIAFLRLLFVAACMAVVYGIVSLWAGSVQGDPYERRAEGAANICPIEDWEGNAAEGGAYVVYKCADESQRLAAAAVVAERDLRYREGLSATAAVVVGGLLVRDVVSGVVARIKRQLQSATIAADS